MHPDRIRVGVGASNLAPLFLPLYQVYFISRNVSTFTGTYQAPRKDDERQLRRQPQDGGLKLSQAIRDGTVLGASDGSLTSDQSNGSYVYSIQTIENNKVKDT